MTGFVFFITSVVTMKKCRTTSHFQFRHLFFFFSVVVSILSSLNANAVDWSSSAHDILSAAETLGRGKSTFSFATQGRELTERLSNSGRKEQIFAPVSVQKNPLSSSSEEVSAEKIRLDQFRVVPSWAHGITSQWTIGAMLPIINSNITSISTENGEKEKRAIIRIGNVELLSKELLLLSSKNSFALSQRLRFPSAQDDKDEEAVVPVTDPNGYGIGMGAIFDHQVLGWWTVGLSTEYCLNLSDKSLDFSTAEKTDRITRDPGDVTTVGVHTIFDLASDIDLSLSASHLYKNRDSYKIKTAINESTSYSEQTGGEVGLTYTPENETSRDDLYSIELKYFATLAGRNIQDEDTLSMQMQFYY